MGPSYIGIIPAWLAGEPGSNPGGSISLAFKIH